MGDLCGHFNTFKELGLEVINHRQQWGQTITSILTPLIGEEYSFSVGVFITFFDLACRDEWSNASPSVCPSEWPLDDTDRHDDDDDEEEEEVDWCCSSLIQRGGSVGVMVLVGLNMFCACFVMSRPRANYEVIQTGVWLGDDDLTPSNFMSKGSHAFRVDAVELYVGIGASNFVDECQVHLVTSVSVISWPFECSRRI